MSLIPTNREACCHHGQAGSQPPSPASHEAGVVAHSSASVAQGTIYTCPMHPQIRQAGPGSCPICGMALEPEVATLSAEAGTGAGSELTEMRRRFWVALALAAPVFAL